MRHERIEITLMGMEDWKGRGDPADALTLLRRQKLPTVGTLDECYHVLGRWAIAKLRDVGAWDRQALVDLLLLKHAMYGPVNLRWHGQLGIVVRISDKAARLDVLSRAELDAATGDALLDTLRDLVGYCALGSMMLGGGTT